MESFSFYKFLMKNCLQAYAFYRLVAMMGYLSHKASFSFAVQALLGTQAETIWCYSPHVSNIVND